MILEQGDMFSVWGKTDMFLFTSNPIVNRQGLAVMGRGIAKQLADKYPTIRKDFADRMKALNDMFIVCNCDFTGYYDEQAVGFFHVKNHWREQASLEVIAQSVEELKSWIMDDEMERVDLNFPGIGNGRLRRDLVLPIISTLPDVVHVWEYGVDQEHWT